MKKIKNMIQEREISDIVPCGDLNYVMTEEIYNNKKFEQLRNEIRKYDELKHLFENEFIHKGIKDTQTDNVLSHLQKCVILSPKFYFLEEYINLYLKKDSSSINYDMKSDTALTIALRTRVSNELVRILLNFNPEINKLDMVLCLRNGYPLNITRLIVENFHPNYSIMDHAIVGGDKDVIRFMLEKMLNIKSSPDENGIKSFLKNMENCDAYVGNNKLIEILSKAGYSEEVISIAINKVVKISETKEKSCTIL